MSASLYLVGQRVCTCASNYYVDSGMVRTIKAIARSVSQSQLYLVQFDKLPAFHSATISRILVLQRRFVKGIGRNLFEAGV